MANYSTIRVRPSAKKVTLRLAKKYEMNILDFYDAMANYFDTTGVNPKDMVILSPAEEMKKLRDSLVSFIRKQEKDFILPVFSRVDVVMNRFQYYIEHEAPRVDQQSANRPSAMDLSLNLPKPESKKSSSQKDSAETDTTQKLKELQKEYNHLQKQHLELVSLFDNLLSKTTLTSTGISKKPVIALPMAQIEEYKKFIKLVK
jgi:hypothetical protein